MEAAPFRCRERERLRTLVNCEELLPTVGLERVAKQGESASRTEGGSFVTITAR